ncbi:MAG: hypothetical protein RLY78_3712 [Pseudomonadota bacterium]|jgi:opacity protein-like surface antigen|uniref:Porin family protein n=1 Tax=Pseudaquabacterium rugosum TaxID=2984194 RepID=A0ABU9BI85_9BURK
MRLSPALILPLLVAAAAPAASAQDLHVGLQAGRLTYKEDGFDPFKSGGWTLSLGTRLAPQLALEARVGRGTSTGQAEVMGLPMTIRVDRWYGAFLRGFVPVADTGISAYGLIGATRGKMAYTVMGQPDADTDSDVSWGIGAELPVTPQLSVTLEWARLFTGATYRVDQLSGGLNWKF